MSVLKKFHNKIKTFRFLFTLSKADNSFCSFSKKKWKSKSENNTKGEVIIDILWSDDHIFQLSYIANYFYINHGLIPKYYQIIHREKILLRFFFSFFRKFTRLHKLYLSFGCGFAFGQKKYKKSKKIINSLKFSSKKELLDYQIETVRIGDLIYDAYLREYEVGTVDLSDKNLYQMVHIL